MKSNYTHASILIDRSGSMSSIKAAIIKAFNDLIQEQLAETGEMTVSLAQFDSTGFTHNENNMRYEMLNDFSPLKNVTLLTESNYNPMGGTPLNDAVVKIVRETGEKLGLIPESLRPEKVLIVIISDGQENSSGEFSEHKNGSAKLAEIIKHQEDRYNWKFLYVGANQDSAREAGSRGMSSSYNYAATNIGVHKMGRTFSRSMSKMRGADLTSYASMDLTSDMLESEKEIDEEDKLKP